jgi:hypothetical protein
MLTSHFSWLPVYFIFSSWLRFSSFILLNIIILVIPLPTLDDTNDNHQHHAYDDISHHATSQTQTRQPTSYLANEKHLPWHQHYLHDPATPCSFAPSARTRHHRQQYITDEPDKRQQDYEDTWYLAMQAVQQKIQHYHYPIPDAPLPWQYQQYLNNPAPAPCSIASSTRKRHQQHHPTHTFGTTHKQPNTNTMARLPHYTDKLKQPMESRKRRPQNVPGTNCTNKQTHPTEFCAFCACKRHQRINTMPFAFSNRNQWPQCNSARGNDTNNPNTDGITFLTFSTPKKQRRHNHGSEKDTGDKRNATTLSLATSTPNQRHAGIRTTNYYECLYNGNTDEDDNEYGTATTNDEYQHTPIKTNGLNNHTPDNHTPSQPSSLHDISTLIPPPVPPCSTMTHQNIHGTNATHNGNDINGTTAPPGNITSIQNTNGNTKSNTGNMNGNEHNGTAQTNGYNGATSSNDTHSNNQDSHTSIKWQPQARPIIQWTRQHLDSYLALAEVACEWNVDPG